MHTKTLILSLPFHPESLPSTHAITGLYPPNAEVVDNTSDLCPSYVVTSNVASTANDSLVPAHQGRMVVELQWVAFGSVRDDRLG